MKQFIIVKTKHDILDVALMGLVEYCKTVFAKTKDAVVHTPVVVPELGQHHLTNSLVTSYSVVAVVDSERGFTELPEGVEHGKLMIVSVAAAAPVKKLNAEA